MKTHTHTQTHIDTHTHIHTHLSLVYLTRQEHDKETAVNKSRATQD